MEDFDIREQGAWLVVSEGLAYRARSRSVSKSPKVTETFEYCILKDALAETFHIDGERLYYWPVEMVNKTWFDLNRFLPAFKRALLWHEASGKPLFDEQIFARTADYAFEYAVD